MNKGWSNGSQVLKEINMLNISTIYILSTKVIFTFPKLIELSSHPYVSSLDFPFANLYSLKQLKSTRDFVHIIYILDYIHTKQQLFLSIFA